MATPTQEKVMRHLKKLHQAMAVEFKSAPATANQDVTNFGQPASVLDLPYLRFVDLMVTTGLKKSTLWAIQDPRSPQFDEGFPPSYRLTPRTRVWKTAEVLAWIHSKQIVRAPTSNRSFAEAKGV